MSIETMNKNIINADDVGISPGCNIAVKKACEARAINSISIFGNGEYLDDAIVNIVRKYPDVSFGVHLDLTYGRSFTKASELSKYGLFNCSYPLLLIKAYTNSCFLKEVEKEFEAQIDNLIAHGVSISHIDSHRHVHMIGPILKICQRLAGKYNIANIRIPNDSLLFSIFRAGRMRKITLGGIVKSLFLKTLSFISGAKQQIKFFSILYSGNIDRSMFESVMKKSVKPIEIMLHTGFPEKDINVQFCKELEGRYWRSRSRSIEYDACIAFTTIRELNEN